MKAKQLHIIAAITLFLLGFLSGIRVHKSWSGGDKEILDTVVVYRTAILKEPPLVIESIPAPDSIPLVTIPTTMIIEDEADTTVVSIRPEVVTVFGRLDNDINYLATLTGIQPSIQNLSVSYPKYSITRTVLKPYNGYLLSACADFAVSTMPQMHAVSRLTFEASYNTGPFHLALQAGVMRGASQGTHPYIGGRISFDIYRKR